MEHGIECLREIIKLVDSDEQNIWFPIEFRYVKQDDIWLSPFYQRDTCSIAVHQYYEDDYHRFHKAAQEIFVRYNGRPHWGKNHYLKADTFKHLYPKWQQFQEIRQFMAPPMESSLTNTLRKLCWAKEKRSSQTKSVF
jgi:FAD/FMN-containing dehydrogenase